MRNVLESDEIVVKELNNLVVGDKVVLGKDASVENGIYVHKDGFDKSVVSEPGRFVESSFTNDYDYLIELMRHEKENGGHILWVLGPSVVFDYYMLDCLGFHQHHRDLLQKALDVPCCSRTCW